MKLALITFLSVISLVGSVVFAQDNPVSIFQLQYTTAADGKSPYHLKQFVDCLGGVVIAKVSRSVPRIVIQDPTVYDAAIQGADCYWGAIQIKDWTYGDLIDHINIGDWIELNNVPIEDHRGTTFIQYGKGNTKSSFSVVGSNYPIPEPLVVDVNDITSPIEDPTDPGSYYVGNHNAEKFESMRIKVTRVSVVEKGPGKAGDNYVLQSSDEPDDANFSCWAADYMNPDAAGDYHPYVEEGQHFCSVEGFLEQYTNISDGFDYYQIITTGTDDFLITQPADFDGDCDVDLVDFSGFSEYWFASCPTDPNLCGGADLTDNGIVDMDDLTEFTSNWMEGLN